MLLGFLFTGCQTTGDPTQGGLFGWSEKKAQVRQQSLEQGNEQAQQQLSSAQQQQSRLRRQQAGLEGESVRLRGEVDRLMNENAQLEGQLRRLVQERHLDEAELGRLNTVLAQNEQLRETLRTPNTAPPPERQPDVVNGQNDRLHREILLLLGR
jgi:hypothetical protein